MPKVKKLKHHSNEHSRAHKPQPIDLGKNEEDVYAAKGAEANPQQLQPIVERNIENKVSRRALQQILEQQLRELTSNKHNAKLTEESNVHANRVAHEKCQQLKAQEQHLAKLEQDLQVVKAELEQEQWEHNEVLAQSMRLNQKFTELETYYDKEMESLRASLANKMKEIKEKDMQCLDIMNQFASYRKQCETNLEEQKKTIVNMKSKSNEDELELQKIQTQNEELLAVNNKLKQQLAAALQQESEIEELRRQLAEKDETIKMHQKENAELEKAKNQTIEELSFKIRKIENVFDQPVKIVAPLSSSNRAQNAATERTGADAAAPIILTNELIVAADNDIIPPPRSQTYSQNNREQQSQPMVLATPKKTAMPQPINTRRRRLPSVTYQLSPNEFASDDNSDMDWQPRLLTTLIPNGHASTSRRNRRSRSPDVDVVVPDSPINVSDVFDRLKRLKPN